jgi:hypothetical protein
VSLLFEGDGQWYRGEVVGWDARRARALLLYDDGEDEWVSLEEERLAWHARLQGHSGVHPGAPRGEAPAGAAALGWRVGVYWPADAAFYCGEVVGWDAGAGVHEVAYDDGERGALTLGADRVKWVLPPGPPLHRQRPGGSADARGRRRGGDESDPDYEAVRPPAGSLAALLAWEQRGSQAWGGGVLALSGSTPAGPAGNEAGPTEPAATRCPGPGAPFRHQHAC